MRTTVLLLLACLPCLPTPAGAQASRVNRCTTAQGDTVFTDRSCDALGATTRMPARVPQVGNTGMFRAGCARRLSELTGQIRDAVSTRDVNRLSSIYLWNNVSDATANHIIGRLETVVQRPLIDIAPVYPDAVDEAPASLTVPGSTDPLPAPVARPRPIGLRLEQTLANSVTPARTVFGLRRQYGCFWITL
ncbi:MULTISPECIES: hypothetical protein [Stenotrophomonas]|jgi:hypothetical protein|uniref:DUF4124 domain-containing protein n=1 Tax=Stenotrophomonas maltophilia TaxID=40324 RepID=A0A4S2D3E6_STEMA|nr:hypothetical protein [Stenotrophomonas sp.]QIO86963.1 hypothetical protein G9274_000648 [Stenotrophomonas rhizophila]TGY35959.1 hypothetical protein E5352_04945 [Stenotrophomonas maltophilia]